jgi:hypothetical protein
LFGVYQLGLTVLGEIGKQYPVQTDEFEDWHVTIQAAEMLFETLIYGEEEGF